MGEVRLGEARDDPGARRGDAIEDAHQLRPFDLRRMERRTASACVWPAFAGWMFGRGFISAC
jgi:hypothetical protein